MAIKLEGIIGGFETSSTGFKVVKSEEVKFRPEKFGTKPAADEPLFTNRYGRRYKKIRGSLKTACAAAGLPYITHHSLRHFFANMLKDQKIDIDFTVPRARQSDSHSEHLSIGGMKLCMVGLRKCKS